MRLSIVRLLIPALAVTLAGVPLARAQEPPAPPPAPGPPPPPVFQPPPPPVVPGLALGRLAQEYRQDGESDESTGGWMLGLGLGAVVGGAIMLVDTLNCNSASTTSGSSGSGSGSSCGGNIALAAGLMVGGAIATYVGPGYIVAGRTKVDESETLAGILSPAQLQAEASAVRSTAHTEEAVGTGLIVAGVLGGLLARNQSNPNSGGGALVGLLSLGVPVGIYTLVAGFTNGGIADQLQGLAIAPAVGQGGAVGGSVAYAGSF